MRRFFPHARNAIAVAIGGVALLLLVRTALLCFAISRPRSFDDSFVTLVYARHFASTGRIFYDTREGPLDGFTSMLDMLLRSLAMRFSSSEPIGVTWWGIAALEASCASVGFLVGVMLFMRAGASRIQSVCGGTLLGFAIAANPALGYGSSFLLETPLYALLAISTAGMFLVWQRPFSPVHLGSFVASMSALTIARPEGLAIALVIGAATLLDERVATHRRRAVAGAAFAAFVLGYYTFHRAYFGAWAPNSYYAKASASRMNELRDGLEYVADYSRSEEGWLLLSFVPGPVACLFRHWRKPELRMRCIWISFVSLLSLLIVVVAGGDCYRGGRFMATPLCLAALALAAAAAGLLEPFRYGAIAILAGIAAVEMAPFVSPASKTALWQSSRALQPPDERTFSCDRLVATRLTRLVGRGTIGQTDYQRLKYFADDARVLDFSGLNDRKIAHQPVTESVLWGKTNLLDMVARAPEVIVLGHHARAQSTPMSEHSLLDALKDRRLRDRYFGYHDPPDDIERLAQVYVSGSIPVCRGYFSILIRRDFVDVAREGGALIGS